MEIAQKKVKILIINLLSERRYTKLTSSGEGVLFTQVSYPLSKLIQDIEIGEIGLPDIQRPFVWTSTKVRDLFDSMYKGFPVGYLLFWSNEIAASHRQIGNDNKQKRVPRLLIVDGQQRLTSLFAVIRNVSVKSSDYSDQHIAIAFRPKDGRFETRDAATEKDPEFIPNISELWSRKHSTTGFIKQFIENVKKHRIVTSQEEERILEVSIERLSNLLNYPFTAIELSNTLDEEQVGDIFVRINSQGAILKRADFILTLMSVFWDEGRQQLEKFCLAARQPSINTASPFNYFISPEPDDLLRVSVALGFRRARLQFVYSILRGKDLETREFSDNRRIKQFDILEESQKYVLDLKNWHEFLKTLLLAGFRSESMITSKMAILYSYAMFLIGQRDFNLDYFDLRKIISKWFFVTSLTGRYTGSFESAMESDIAQLREVKNSQGFVEMLERSMQDVLTEDFWNITLPNNLATSASRSPALFAYKAALIILDAQALFSDIRISELSNPAVKRTKSAIERHHIFPKKYLQKIGITENTEINQIANYAFLEWSDNIDISDLPPAIYFSKYIERMSSQMRYWHAIPERWENMDYHEFLRQRRKLIARGKIGMDGLSI